MGSKCSLKWQKKCYPVAFCRWETYLHWSYCFWAIPLVHPHKNICPMSLRSPVDTSSGTLHKSVWWRLTGYIWLAHISKTEQRTSFFVTVPSIWMVWGWSPKKGCLPCSKMGKIICAAWKWSCVAAPVQSHTKERSRDRVYEMQSYFKWNLKPTTRNKCFLHNAVAMKGEHIFQTNCKRSGNSWLAISSKWYEGEGRDTIQHKSYF